MTISTTTSRQSYNGNGVTTIFSVPFRFFQNADLVVQLVTNSTGASTTLVLGTHYTVSGADAEAGGSVTMVTPPAVGQTLVVRRVIAATQEVDYVAGDPFPAETHERALDRLTMLSQQGEEVNSRSLTLPAGDTTSGEIPQLFIRANKLLAFDSVGRPTVVNPSTDSATDVRMDLASTASGKGAELVGFLPAGTGAAATTVQSKLREIVSVEDFGAVGDGVASDSGAFALTKVASAVALLPAGTYNLGATLYTGLVYGPGEVRMQGSLATANSRGNFLGFDPAGSNVYATPNIWSQEANGFGSSPDAGGKYYNVAVAPGSNIRTASGNVWRSTLIGSSVGQYIQEWERVEAIGNGAMRFAKLANRVTAVGTLALQWLGANNQQHLRDTAHDFWISAPYPGDVGWDFMGLETRNPGIGAYLDSFTAYPTTRDQCSSLVAVGRDAALHTIKDNDSVYIGYQAGTNTFDVLYNVAIGSRALRDGVRATRCVAVGRSAGVQFQQGSGNIYVGNIAGQAHVRGNHSIFIGENAGAGLGADVTDTLVVQNRADTDPLLLGNAATTRLGVGVTTLAMLNELPTRGLMLASPDGGDAPTMRFRFGDTTVIDGQSYGQIEWFGSDNQGTGVRAKIVAESFATLGAAQIKFYTQPSSTPGNTPVERFSIRHNGAVNFRPLSADPTDSPAEGDVYFNTTAKVLRFYNGTAWGNV